MDIVINHRTNDLDLVNGDLATTVPLSKEEIGQRTQLRLYTRAKEWFMNTSFGVPYIQEFLGRKNNKDYIDSYLLAVILETEGVENVLEFRPELDKVTRKYSLYTRIQTVAGEAVTVEVSV